MPVTLFEGWQSGSNMHTLGAACLIHYGILSSTLASIIVLFVLAMCYSILA